MAVSWRDATGTSAGSGSGSDDVDRSDGSSTVINNVTIINSTTDVTGDADASTEASVYYVDASGGEVTLNLPVADAGLQLFFKKTDFSSNKVIVSGGIDDMPEVWLTQQYDALHLMAAESGWSIV